MKSRSWWRPLVLVAVLASVFLIRQMADRPAGEAVPPPAEPERSAGDPASGDLDIAAAFRDRRSDVWVESSGMVEKLLPDDNEGSRHQRFILRLDSGQTLLVSHNIDLAPRVPLREGDPVEFRGEYEWNARGGILH